MDLDTGEYSENAAAKVERDTDVRVQQMRLLWKSPLPQLANGISAAIVCGISWGFAPHRELVIWLGLAMVTALAHLYFWHACRRLRPTPDKARYWAFSFTILSGFAAGLWGLSPWLIPGNEHIVAHVILTFMIAGMGAGAVATNSVHLPALYAHLAASSIPLAAAFIWWGQPVYLAMGVMVVLFALLLAMIGRHFNKWLLGTFNLQIDNTTLVDKLTTKRSILESTVTERTAELRREIAERGRMEQSLRAALQSAEIANRGKSEFLANMNHELRTPLNSVIAFAEIIRDQRFGPVGMARYLEYAEHIHDSGQRLLEVINDIMDLARIESGREELNEEDVDIRKVVRSVLALMKSRADASGVVIETEFPKTLPKLRADARKLKQILVHLLSNSIKFTRRGGRARLAVRCDRSSGYTIEVTDTGIGIDAEDLARVLTPFVQADGRFDRRHGGTGLGLPLTKSLMELHGGSLDVHSEVGVGTSVAVSFPAERVEAPNPTVRVASKRRQG